MNFGLADKVAIVTGSARGLGAAMAARLAEESAKVVVMDIQRERAEKTAAALRAKGHFLHCVIGDITKAADMQRLVDVANSRSMTMGEPVLTETYPDSMQSLTQWDECASLRQSQAVFQCASQYHPNALAAGYLQDRCAAAEIDPLFVMRAGPKYVWPSSHSASAYSRNKRHC
jgi:NAD(P)-dependent dehydrogenase (short-subunit alcohol dehydrogenase family)